MGVGLAGVLRRRYLRFFGRTLTLVPVLVGLFLFYMLGFSAQVFEVYLIVLEGDRWAGVCGLAGVVVLCLLLHAWHYEFATLSMDRDYPEHADPFLDRMLCRVRNTKAIVIAMLPCLGAIFGLWQTLRLVRGAQTGDGAVGKLFASDDAALAVFAKATVDVRGQADAFAALLVVLFVSLALVTVLVALTRRRQSLRGLLYGAWVMAGLYLLLAWFVPGGMMAVAGVIGALGVFCLLSATLIALLSLVTRGSDFGVPLMAILVVLVAIYFGVKIKDQIGPEPEEPGQSAVATPAARQVDDERILRREFDRWIDARRPAADGARIPVFIFALQGGGIYAASAGASLLARLEDRCPGFSRNIFAVSGVSGGSVGAVLYNSIAEAHMAAGPARCAKLAPPGSAGTTDLVRRAIRKDHLAPVGMFIVPDLIGRLAFGGTAFGRAEALEGSLKRALAGLPGGSAAVKAADAEFVGHWNPATARVPAPILNTTWVETGFRVAFAPFQLKPTGDGTLYSFADRVFVGSPGNESAEVRSVTVMQAAVTSARFPGAMGAWQLRDHVVEIAAPGRGNGTEQITKTWNFVDGGYADGSGVSTALEIYQKLKSYIDEGKRADGRPLPDIDLRLIVLTESPPQLDLSKVANGTKFSDTVAPVAALLNVRSLLASRAVTSAADQLSSQDRIVPGDIGLATTGRLGDPKRKSSLLVVRLDLDDFPLTLGWTISDFSNSTIRLMLGEAELCRDLEPAPERSRDTILGNSCVQRELLSLFGIPFAPLVPRPVRASARR